MNIAITGATGLLGRNLVHYLTSQGHHCRCWYRPESNREGFAQATSHIRWIPGDISCPHDDAITDLLKGSDAVVHAALIRDTPAENAGEPAFPQEENLRGSLRLMQAAHQANISRFVYISSCGVYGNILSDRNLDEHHPTTPHSHYGAHKAAVEAFVSSYGHGAGWDICALRPTFIYGPKQPLEKSRWYELTHQVARGENVDCTRGGKIIHALDIARCVELVISAPDIAGEIYNCTDVYMSDYGVAEIARELSGSQATITGIRKEPVHIMQATKLKTLGMRFGGKELLRKTIKAMLEHQAT